MKHQDIREKFKDFFESKGHKWVESSSLMPNDPSVLFTTAGMQQFKPYYTGQADAMKDFGSLNTASIQKSMRTSDIDEVGDESHLTFFEMLGNFSFGGYWKEAAIAWAHEFITKELGLKIDYVSVFGGSKGMPTDEESELLWKEVDKNIKIKKMGIEDNTWGPTGNEGPCGPTTEIYVNGVEIWNIVFNQFYYKGNREQLLKETDPGKFENLKTAGIDTGMGLERLTMVVQGKNNIFETDLFEPLMALMPDRMTKRAKRISADHARAIVFLITDGIRPSNKEQGYVLRRLIRRMIIHTYNIGSIGSFSGTDIVNINPNDLLSKVIDLYSDVYSFDKNVIFEVFTEEWSKFQKTSGPGLRYLKSLKFINSKIAFEIYSSFGIPFEVIRELGPKDGDLGVLNREEFETERKRHQEISRAGAEKKFGGHGLLLDTGELKAGNEEELKKATRLHTATHLLHASLRKVLGPEVHQAGSDITAERLRFDFNFSRKLTPEELQKIEDLANEAVGKNYKVTKEEMAYEDAIKSGALAFFKLKYPPKVNVYSVGDFSKELCGGPHVSHTSEIGHIKITKEEAVSSGVRRIKAIVD